MALNVLEQHAPAGARLVGYAGVGLAYTRWQAAGDAAATGVTLARLRRALAELGGYVVVEHAPAALRPTLDLWGQAPATLGLMRALKAQWDPQAVLNRGRYVGGI